MIRSLQPNSLTMPRSFGKYPSNVSNGVEHAVSSTATTGADDDDDDDERGGSRAGRHLYVLPVLLLEFLALALTRAVLPAMLLERFEDRVYFVMGCAEFCRGLLAFVACPLIGKVSDVVGRRVCLFVTVLGTCAPVCALALLPARRTGTLSSLLGGVDHDDDYDDNATAPSLFSASASRANNGAEEEGWMMYSSSAADNYDGPTTTPVDRVLVFVCLFALSGVFSATFTLTFAYVSDTVTRRDDRVAAYGLALATFGLSFTVGPAAGGYLARDATTTTDVGRQRVFSCALLLTVLDLLYVYFVLPESRPDLHDHDNDHHHDNARTLSRIRRDVVPRTWSPLDTLKVFSRDPVMAQIGRIVFLYYTGVWAVISTLTLYATKRFRLGPARLGELMSALGLCTMVSEAVLVRVVVPVIGEKRSMLVGLCAFGAQCAVLGLANEAWQLYLCVAFSAVANLVYPSLVSLVSGAVDADRVGEALGAVNGVKALTEGVGPLLFGTLMTLSERSALPGWPYLLAAAFSFAALRRAIDLPDDDDEDYVSERYPNDDRGLTLTSSTTDERDGGRAILRKHATYGNDAEEELCGLLSEIEDDDD